MRSRCFVCCALVAALVPTLYAWKSDHRPRLFGDKIPRKALATTFRRVQKKIVTYHNFFRAHVSPPAANMLRMSWHKGAARAAQKWSDQCLMLTHDSPVGRWVDNFGTCGQNIFISTQQVPWYFAMKMWFLEKNNFTYGSSHNDLNVVGHYTQLAWSATHKVGCGFTKCDSGGRRKPYYSYVCNYCPIGNFLERLGRPYDAGQPCSGCANHCRNEKLCGNSCHAADFWANCLELNATWHDWLCNSHNREGRERHKFCKATCDCKGKIV